VGLPGAYVRVFMGNIINLSLKNYLDKKGCCPECRRKPIPTKKRKGFLYCPTCKSYFSALTGQQVPNCDCYGKDGEYLVGRAC